MTGIRSCPDTSYKLAEAHSSAVKHQGSLTQGKEWGIEAEATGPQVSALAGLGLALAPICAVERCGSGRRRLAGRHLAPRGQRPLIRASSSSEPM